MRLFTREWEGHTVQSLYTTPLTKSMDSPFLVQNKKVETLPTCLLVFTLLNVKRRRILGGSRMGSTIKTTTLSHLLRVKNVWKVFLSVSEEAT